MIINIGFMVLLITFCVSIYGIGAAIWGNYKNQTLWIESAHRALSLAFPLISIAVICLFILLLSDNFHIQYVASVSSRSMPKYLKISAFWMGRSGSLLLWLWLLTGSALLVLRRDWQYKQIFSSWMMIVFFTIIIFFLGDIIFYNNPFARLWYENGGYQKSAFFQPENYQALIPLDGNGFNPVFRHLNKIIQIPLLYCGFVLFITSYVYSVAALITNRLDDEWVHLVRRWTLLACLFMFLALLSGARWSYDMLDWHEHWRWQTSEILILLPLFSSTAFLHSLRVQQQRGLFKRWNFFILSITYSLIVMALLITRIDPISSIHSSALRDISLYYSIYISLVLLINLCLLFYKWNKFGLISSKTNDNLCGLMILGMNIFMGCMVLICMIRILFPQFINEIFHQKLMVGLYNPAWSVGFIMFVFLLLMGIASSYLWNYSSIACYLKMVWKTLVVITIILVMFYLMGIQQVAVLLGFGICLFLGMVVITEFVKGVLFQKKSNDENLLLACFQHFVRYKLRYGRYFIHIGVVFIVVAMMSVEIFHSETQVSLTVGDRMKLDGYSITYDKIVNFDTTDGRNVTLTYLNGSDYLGREFVLYPRRYYYYDTQQSVTIADIQSTLFEDLYIVPENWDTFHDNKRTAFKLYHNPLMFWFWAGGVLLIAGVLLIFLLSNYQISEFYQFNI